MHLKLCAALGIEKWPRKSKNTFKKPENSTFWGKFGRWEDGQPYNFLPNYKVVKKQIIFNFLKNQASRISSVSQPFWILFFWARSHLKPKKRLNKMRYFSCLRNEITGIKNFKNLLGNTEVWAILEKLQCEDSEKNQCHIRNQHTKLNRMTYISFLNNFPSHVHPWSPPAVYLIHFACSPSQLNFWWKIAL